MTDGRCRDERGQPHIRGARKGVAPSAFRAPTSKSRMRSKIMKKITITSKIRYGVPGTLVGMVSPELPTT